MTGAQGITAIPVLPSFDCAVGAVAAYRPTAANPDVTRAMSDLGWISSMLIWPPLAFGMILAGIVILRTWQQPGAFAPNGPGSWYLAVFTWGPWIILSSIAQVRLLAQQHRSQAPAQEALAVSLRPDAHGGAELTAVRAELPGDSERAVASLLAHATALVSEVNAASSRSARCRLNDGTARDASPSRRGFFGLTII
jgi:hypothetical protein